MNRTAKPAAPPRTLGLIVAAVLASLLAACAQSSPTFPVPITSQPDPLSGTRWQLVAVVVDGRSLDVPASPVLFARFDDGMLRVSGGCNNIMALYRSPESPVGTVVASTTLEDCTALMPQVMAVEAAIYAALQSPGTPTTDGTHLVLRSPDTTLVFHRADASPTPATSPRPTTTLRAPTPTATAAATAPATATPTPTATEPASVPTYALPTPDAAFATALAEHLAAFYARDASAEDLQEAANVFATGYYGSAPRYAYVSEGAAPVLITAPVVPGEPGPQYVPYFCWPDADAGALCQGWPQQSPLWHFLTYQPTRVRVVQAGSTLEMGLITGPLGNTSQFSYALLRLSGGAWTAVWTPADDEDSRRWLTDLGGDVRFLGEGLDSLQLCGRLPGDVPVARFFYEDWRFAVHQDYLSRWQRQGDAYVRVHGEVVESPVTALTQFMLALTQGDLDAARERASRPAVLGEAAALGLDRLIPQQWAAMREGSRNGVLLLRDLGDHQNTGPAYRVILVKPSGRWLVDGVEYLLTPSPTPRPPLPTATPHVTTSPG
ncbi:MAG: META domain-containing protein [Anaerolineae bacterium]